jgi:ABC-type long-subunit fatty acid transport system fused permease/ATPase subunit
MFIINDKLLVNEFYIQFQFNCYRLFLHNIIINIINIFIINTKMQKIAKFLTLLLSILNIYSAYSLKL